MNNLLTIDEASRFATKHLNRKVSNSNISYLIQYGRVKRFSCNGSRYIEKQELVNYYKNHQPKREREWKKQLGNDLNWTLSFQQYNEAETTKHVHRLHPYKGKFIPQLVEYFLDNHTDNFKREIYFQRGDIVLDPFCGSGTTLIQANEIGIHGIGIDVSDFNSFISNVKIGKYNFNDLKNEIKKITKSLEEFIANFTTVAFENELYDELKKFNNKYFPVPEYKYKVRKNLIDEKKYGAGKTKEFLKIYQQLVEKYNIKLKQKSTVRFLDKWYLQNVRTEIDFVFNRIKQISSINTKKVMGIVLSRTMRSCRATSHADLATLKEPVTEIYYCSKHGKICKPLFSILSWWKRYSYDTVKRLLEFEKLKTNTYQICLTGNARNINILESLKKRKASFAKLVKEKKIKGIFSSPPYIGLIDYHEQHAYAYDLLGFKRKDALEIGSLFRGQGLQARKNYIQGISEVLNNSKKFLINDYNVFLVANDKYNMYSTIADNAGMKIVNQFKRPVLNRTEKDKVAYSEIIFHLKTKL